MKKIKNEKQKKRWMRSISIMLIFALCLSIVPIGGINPNVSVKAVKR